MGYPFETNGTVCVPETGLTGPTTCQVYIFLRENFHSFVQLIYTEHLLDAGHRGNNTELTLEQRLR